MSDVPPAPGLGGADLPVPAPYPLRLEIDEPTGPRNRLTAFFRIITAIPALIVLAAVVGGYNTGILFFPVLLLILFRKKYPRWWFDWNLAFLRFHNRIIAYTLLLSDEYPSTDEEQAVHLDIDYPDLPDGLSRGLPIVKWFLAIPHYIVLYFLYIGSVVVAIVSWFAVVFTGHLPRSLFDYQVGVMRWADRVAAYAILLTTDRYPPFSFAP